MKIYIDTNVLIDFVCRREPFAENAKRLFALGYLGKAQLSTSALSFVNTMYIAHKYGHEEVKGFLLKVAEFVEVADLKGDIAISALTADWKDYEDATQNITATQLMSDCIVTRNKKDFKNSALHVYTVNEILNLL